MLDVTTENLPVRWARDVQGDPERLLGAFASWLAERGYRVDAGRPLSPESGGALAGGLRGVRDTEVYDRSRTLGRRIAVAGVGLAVVSLLLMMGGVQSRALLSPLMLASVVLIGYGLNRLREPAKHRLRVVDVALAGATGGLTMTVREGVGESDGDGTVDWLGGEPSQISESQIEELVGSASGEGGAR
jgi:hypothetical protein